MHGSWQLLISPVLHSENLSVKLWNSLKAVSINDGVHKEKPLACVHVLFPHGTEILHTVSLLYVKHSESDDVMGKNMGIHCLSGTCTYTM